jgi:hypothetical protein
MLFMYKYVRQDRQDELSRITFDTVGYTLVVSFEGHASFVEVAVAAQVHHRQARILPDERVPNCGLL